MKQKLKANFLTFAALGAGAAAMALRWLLYALAPDEKNLLPVLHPVEVLLWAVTAAAGAFLILSVRKLSGSNRYGDNFGPSLAAMAGALCMAAGVLVTVLTAESELAGPVGLLWKASGFLSVPGLVLAGICRGKGQRPVFLCHFVLCVFLALHMVTRYQLWSSNPQLQDYFYSLGGVCLLMLFAYYQTAFDVGSGQRRMQLGTGLLGAVFCFAAAANSECAPLYLAGGIWMLTNLCTQTPVLHRKNGAQEQKEA